MPPEIVIPPSAKVHAALSGIRCVRSPSIQRGFGNGRRPLDSGPGEAAPISELVRAALGKVCESGKTLLSLTKLRPYEYNTSAISLGANALAEETGLSLVGCIELTDYGTIREVAKDFINVSRFGDSALAERLYLRVRNWGVTDAYMDTMLTAFATVGEALMYYSEELIAGGNDWNARLFLKKCSEKVFPLLNPSTRWESGLALLNEFADALDGEEGLTSIRNISNITATVRSRMRDSNPLLERKEKYTNDIDEGVLSRHAIH
jgi:hypothetical protein